MNLVKLEMCEAVFSFHLDDLQALARVMRAGLDELTGADEAVDQALGGAMLASFQAASVAVQCQLDTPGGPTPAGERKF